MSIITTDRWRLIKSHIYCTKNGQRSTELGFHNDIVDDQRDQKAIDKAIINTYLFSNTRYQARESFQSIRSIVFEPLFMSISIFFTMGVAIKQ